MGQSHTLLEILLLLKKEEVMMFKTCIFANYNYSQL